jgi:imidazolonepropionase-like amidohydrolase
MGMDVGKIKRGMIADLLLIDGNPLTDVTVLQDKTRMPMVMKGGVFHRMALPLAGHN